MLNEELIEKLMGKSFSAIPPSATPLARETLSNREVYSRMHAGGTSKPLVTFKGIRDNEIWVTCPKKYTIPYGVEHLYCQHRDFPDHVVSINYIVEDGYTCVILAENCEDTIINVRPGFDNEEIMITYKNPLINKQAAKHILKKWDTE